MIKEVILTGAVLMSPVDPPKDMRGYWEDESHAVFISLDHSSLSIGEINWYTTGYSLGQDVWYSGELYHSPKADAYCADLHYGKSIWSTVFKPTPSIGTVCFDVVGNVLLVGYSTKSPDFVCPWNDFRHSINNGGCSGNLDLHQ